MPQFKVGFDYNDKVLKRLVKKDEEVEMTLKRANQVNKTLEKYGVALTRIDDK